MVGFSHNANIYIYVYAIIVNPQCIYTMIMNKTPPLLRPNPRSFHIVAESIGNSDVLLVNRKLMSWSVIHHCDCCSSSRYNPTVYEMQQ